MALVIKDVGSEIEMIAGGGTPTTSAFATVAGTTTFTGFTIDRLLLSRRYLSAKAGVLVTGTFTGSSAALWSAHGISATVRMFDSSAGVAWTAYGTSQDCSYTWTATSSGLVRASLNTRWDLSRARRYIRWQYDGLAVQSGASSAATEGALIAGLAVALGGGELLPPATGDNGAIST